MIDALVSGSAARAVFIQGSSVHFIDADDPQNIRPSNLAAINHLLADANDVVRLKINKYSDCYNVLLSEWQRDRALRMLQIVLINDDPEDTLDASECLERLLREEHVYNAVLNLVYSVPYPNFPSIDDALFNRAPITKTFYSQLREDQEAIGRVRQAFDALIFPSETIKLAYEAAAVPSGLFRLVVELALGRSNASDVIFSCVKNFKHLPDSRALATQWVNNFTAAGIGRRLRPLDELAVDEAAYELDEDSRHRGDRHSIFVSVTAQIEAIIAKLEGRETDAARRYAEHLIGFQLQSGSTEFVAKSLSRLATEARRRNLHDIELEWAERAVAVRPEDGWARALLGDTYLLLYRLRDAEEEFKAASAYGEAAYGSIGRAKVAKERGDLDQALAMFESVRKSGGTHALTAWSGYCSTLREMWKPEETLKAYKEAKDAYPNEIIFQTGYAKALEHLGRFPDAIEAYVQAKTGWPGDPRGYYGEADVYKHAGQFETARELYEKAIELFPYSMEPLVGLADLNRKNGEFAKALNLYSTAKEAFPYSPLAQIGAADVLLDERNYRDALSIYDNAIGRFPLEVSVRNGRANAYKRVGQFQEALRLYDENVHDFPYNFTALMGRANLLKLLGRYDDALLAYDVVLARQPRYASAKASKASIFVARRRFDEAEQLLPQKSPHTRNDWLSYQVRGMLELQRGNIPSAKKIFSEGVSRTPYHNLRTLFQSSLACCDLQMETYQAIPEHLQDSNEPIHVLLRGISLAFSGKFEPAAHTSQQVGSEIPPKLVELKSHLDAVISRRNTRPDERVWFSEATAEAVLRLAA